jgi:hypothetical protein
MRRLWLGNPPYGGCETRLFALSGRKARPGRRELSPEQVAGGLTGHRRPGLPASRQASRPTERPVAARLCLIPAAVTLQARSRPDPGRISIAASSQADPLRQADRDPDEGCDTPVGCACPSVEDRQVSGSTAAMASTARGHTRTVAGHSQTEPMTVAGGGTASGAWRHGSRAAAHGDFPTLGC